ncbi:MAG TPA: DinB family protein [Candidatus Acidoferrum sp.]|nr:DinB family protein [Candidatus Acidoferrum sp.]
MPNLEEKAALAQVKYDEIPRTADERETLVAFLEWQRLTLARKCAGLTAEQLRRRSAAPSTLSLLGLVRHLTDVERGWFRRTLALEDVGALYSTESDPDADFNDIDGADVDETFASWRSECGRASQIIARYQLTDEGRQRTGRAVSLRWILVHMIEEYSRHNGHADLLRQRIDGATGY